MTATFVHRIRRAIREQMDRVPSIRHHIAAARRARLTRRAHDCQVLHREHFRKAAR